MNNSIENIEDLRKGMLKNLELFQNGKLSESQCQLYNSTAGRVVSTLNVELSQSRLLGKREKIPFLEYKSKKDLNSGGDKNQNKNKKDGGN